MYCNPNILFLIWMDGKSQLVCPTEGWFPLARRAEATSCLCLLFSLQREPFGDSNPGRDAESTSPGEKSCLRLQKAYLQQAVLVTFIKIEHWAFLLPCFFVLLAGGCYCKALTPLCSAVRWKSSCPRPRRRQERGDGWTEDTPFFLPRDLSRFYRLWVSLGGGVEKPAMSPNFVNLWSSTVLHQVQLEDCWSLAGTFVIIYWVWRIPDVEGEDRKSINWIGLPGPQGGLLTLACMAQAQLSSIKLLFLLQFGPSNWISSKGLNKKKKEKRGKMYSIKLLYSADSPFALQTNMHSHILNVEEGLLFACDFRKSKHHLSYHPNSLYSPAEDRPWLLFFF